MDSILIEPAHIREKMPKDEKYGRIVDAVETLNMKLVHNTNPNNVQNNNSRIKFLYFLVINYSKS